MTADEVRLVGRLRGGDKQALAELFSSQRQCLARLVSFRLSPRL